MGFLQYNHIALPYPLTHNFSQDCVYEDSQTDQYLTKFDIEVECLITTDHITNWCAIASKGNYARVLTGPDGTPLTQNPANVMFAVRKALLTPRRGLSYKVDGVEMIPTLNVTTTAKLGDKVITNPPTIKGTVDSKNGPLPKYCKLTALNSTTFLLKYKIETHYWENTKVSTSLSPICFNNPTPGAILSHRWTESVEIDKYNLTTKTRDGKYIIRSDNEKGTMADQLRTSILTAPIPNGFTRDMCRYKLSSDGLTLEYTITDKEQFRMPPKPAFEGDGYYREYLNNNGAKRTVDISLRLKGQKFFGNPGAGNATDDAINSSQDSLLRAAFVIVFARIRARATQFTEFKNILGVVVSRQLKGLSILEHVESRYDFFKNEVVVHIRGRLAINIGSNPLLSMAPQSYRFFIPGIGIPVPSSSPLKTFVPFVTDASIPAYTVRGTAGLTMIPPPYFQPDTNGDKPPTGADIRPGQAGINPESA